MRDLRVPSSRICVFPFPRIMPNNVNSLLIRDREGAAVFAPARRRGRTPTKPPARMRWRLGLVFRLAPNSGHSLVTVNRPVLARLTSRGISASGVTRYSVPRHRSESAIQVPGPSSYLCPFVPESYPADKQFFALGTCLGWRNLPGRTAVILTDEGKT